MQSTMQFGSFKELEEIDYSLFYSSFREVFQQRIPRFQDLVFLRRGDDYSRYIDSPGVLARVKDFFSGKKGGSGVFGSDAGTVILSLPAGATGVVAVLSEVDSYFAKHVSTDWLEEFSREIASLFILLKRAGTDPVTGLPSVVHFDFCLRQIPEDASPSLLLVELFPRARSAHEAQIHTFQAVRSLKNIFSGSYPLFSLGHDVFAILSLDGNSGAFGKVARRAFSLLRRDGFRKIHMGIRLGANGVEKEEFKAQQAFEEVQYALQAARKRGPFALCDYSFLQHPETHPLKKPSKSLIAKFGRKWRGVDRFAIAELCPSDETGSRLIRKGLSVEELVCDDMSFYVFLAGMDPEEALEWCEKKLLELGAGDIQVGIAYYPHLFFSKSSTVFHCRKALRHAEFFGPGGRAIFDGVSLNVAGDIYYAEGDLTSAVKEYKTGIACDPENVNLLNSLGVAYADMDKHSEALRYFNMALENDPDNFMALYNSALTAELTNKKQEALGYLEKAMSLSEDESSKESEVVDDVTFRFGRICSLSGRHQRAVEVLKEQYGACSLERMREKIPSHLGRSLFHLGRYDEAVRWLQQALQYNEFDAESMGLLGVCYLKLHQGDEIALSLCRKSAELEPGNGFLKLCLARTLIARSSHEEATVILKSSVKRKSIQTEAQLLICLNYKKQGQLSRAKYWLEKARKSDKVESRILFEIDRLSEELDEV